MDRIFMEKAIELSYLGRGYVNPNPIVGSVIVKNNRVIGEGYHQFYGGSHSEVVAIEDAGKAVLGSTLYVTLEPCCNYGKTPPCTDRIIKSVIKRVVIGALDPNPLVNGSGAQILRDAGIDVTVGVLEKTIKRDNAIFFHFQKQKMPYVILKPAITMDHKMKTKTGESKWITNEKSRLHVHKTRHQVSSIRVGVNAVIEDNPELTARIPNGKNPLVIVLDTKGRIPLEANVLQNGGNTIVVTTDRMDFKTREKIKKTGTQIWVMPEKEGMVCLYSTLKKLWERKIDSVLIEGGETLKETVLKEDLVQRIQLFIGGKIIGNSSLMRDALKVINTRTTLFAEDILIEGDILCLQD